MHLIRFLRARWLHAESELTTIRHWRAHILARLLDVIFGLGLIAASLSAYAAISEQRYAIAVADGIALLWAGLLAWYRRLPFSVRAWGLIAMMFALGCFFLSRVGVVGQLFLLAVPILAALLLGRRAAVAALVLNALLMVAAAVTGHADLHMVGFGRTPMLQGLIITLNFTFVSAVLSYTLSALLEGLESSLARQRQLANFDMLTGLPNRRMLLERLTAHEDAGAAAGNSQAGALLYIDLDHFKNINDARGHGLGDALLRQVAARLTALAHSGDFVARLGGDEFAVMRPAAALQTLRADEAALQLGERILAELARAFLVEGKPYLISATIGVTLLRGDRRSADDLLREADTAMYRAKASGRNRIVFFEEAMQAAVEHRLALENDLGQALGTPQLALHVQPQFTTAGELAGAELLMRWQHPQRGAVSPAEFIPVAEQSGLILPLGEWVLREGCLTARKLHEAGIPATVSVNVSPIQFRHAGFLPLVRALLGETGAPAQALVFEVTEGLFIENFDEIVRRMLELNELGIRFSIDDFGTGYSSLAYLKKLPLFELKIDRSFVDDLPQDANDAAIVGMILSMARHLGLRVVAEGVETAAQASFLAQAQCDVLQGYLYARPLPLADWLAQIRPRHSSRV